MLAPRSIAVVGASESPDSWAPEIERSLRHVGYGGDLFPINPKYDAVWGRPCLTSIAELPRGVDLVVFVVPARVVVGMIDACGARGVKGIMVVSSGFAEATMYRSSGKRTTKPRIWTSRSSRMLSRPTWIRSARSGSSLSVKMPRLVRGMSPNAMVDASER